MATPLCFSQRSINVDEAAESILYELAEAIASEAMTNATESILYEYAEGIAAEAMSNVTKAMPIEVVEAMKNAMAEVIVKDLMGAMINEIVEAIIESLDDYHDMNALANTSMETFAVQRQIRAA
uniref:Uncharacterized protein n=1 Tax=Globodera rostochiensis TaxID=31243 RepID=A0A914IAL1_GLORO